MAGDVKPKAIPKTIVEMLAIITETMAPKIYTWMPTEVSEMVSKLVYNLRKRLTTYWYRGEITPPSY